MNRITFVAACLYYYVKETIVLTGLLMAAVAVLFMIHKLVGWALWVISL
jgi:hypothetical protein